MDLTTIYKEYSDKIKEVFGEDRKIVYGDGNTNADIMLIGEAPGRFEEEQGKPFVGQAGKNLDEFIDILEIKREDLFITNVVKVRPYKINEKTGRKVNRAPNKKEIELSLDTLLKEIEIVSPKIIVTLGNTPLKALLGDVKIGDVHGKLIEYNGRFIYPLYHPASIIYNRSLYDVYIEDLKNLKKYIKSNC
ncbi:uracil-DNA glycosylase [Thermobrachium celere]|uniref:Type-4 uracil-DNA glycosylase n=1 Tax=Thermobrachium celere DSM 8682 TaxID=941824 RepID=R7RUS8_9CLOT|nr:uracil-DNA glycosylase [Thermobrachium celere]GFR36382.1 uracil-DNA glycosylase [Thermobrachium celere]CDF59311.1 Uracil-DNA glycosylase superfamily [Thermobrachium celere DSM 8682]